VWQYCGEKNSQLLLQLVVMVTVVKEAVAMDTVAMKRQLKRQHVVAEPERAS